MNRNLIPITALAAIALAGSPTPAAAQEGTLAEEKLREALKGVTLQLRTAESDKALAMAEKAAAEAKSAELAAQIEKMSKQLSALSEEKAAALDNAEREQARLNSVITAQDAQLKEYKQTFERWKASYYEISDIAKRKDAERAKYARANAELERQVADLRSRNLELYNTGSEILERYRKYSFGDALSAREPFTGINKVKLQNLVQDYQDKLLDQTVKP